MTGLIGHGAYVTAHVSVHELVDGVRCAVQRNPLFDHRQWSLWQAEQLDLAARMIREGYEKE